MVKPVKLDSKAEDKRVRAIRTILQRNSLAYLKSNQRSPRVGTYVTGIRGHFYAGTRKWLEVAVYLPSPDPRSIGSRNAYDVDMRGSGIRRKFSAKDLGTLSSGIRRNMRSFPV